MVRQAGSQSGAGFDDQDEFEFVDLQVQGGEVQISVTVDDGAGARTGVPVGTAISTP